MSYLFSDDELRRMLTNARRVATRKSNILRGAGIFGPGSYEAEHRHLVRKELLKRHVPWDTVINLTEKKLLK